jgi:hypothetical protein
MKGLPAAFVAFVIGCIATYIAYRQYRIAAAKLKLDLFDKRYPICLDTWSALSKIARDGAKWEAWQFGTGAATGIAHKMLPKPSTTPFDDLIPKAAFLFGKDVEDYLKTAATKWVQLREIEGGELKGGISKEENTAKVEELTTWFREQPLSDARKLFGRYLDFERWK